MKTRARGVSPGGLRWSAKKPHPRAYARGSDVGSAVDAKNKLLIGNRIG